MPYLYCPKHGREAVDFSLSLPKLSEELSEYTKVICGLLLKDFYCDKCNQALKTKSLAYLFQYLPSSRFDFSHDYIEYFNDPIFIAYNPEQEYCLAENMYFEHITMGEIKNVLPDDIHNLFKRIWRVRPV